VQRIEHVEWFPYPSQFIYDFLTHPDSLPKVVGRIISARVLERHGDRGKVAIQLDMPMRQVVETVGDVTGVIGEYVTFITQTPFPLEFSWSFSPMTQDGQDGTQIMASLGFDLSAYGVNAAGILVRGMLSAELREDMERLHKALQALMEA